MTPIPPSSFAKDSPLPEDDRMEILNPFDANKLTNEGGQLIPLNNKTRVFKCEQQGVYLFSWTWNAGFNLINYVFGCNWFMGAKLSGMMYYATSLVCPGWLCSFFADCIGCLTGCFNICFQSCLSFLSCSVPTNSGPPSGSETVASVLLAISIFLVGLSILSYGLSIISVGETLMFTIFRNKSDNDNILERKDEEELEVEAVDDIRDDEGDDYDSKV